MDTNLDAQNLKLNRIAPKVFAHLKNEEVAQYLLGKVLCTQDARDRVTAGRIVEVESYQQSDPSSHTFHGQTSRNAAMFERAGTIYVYLSYGIHKCVNIVTGAPGSGEGVLIRALEPIAGLEAMRLRRDKLKPKDLCSGPGKLTQALGIDLTHNHRFLGEEGSNIWLSEGQEINSADIIATTRIGISKNKDAPLRFYIKGNAFVSRK